jgi:hypothetical protein
LFLQERRNFESFGKEHGGSLLRKRYFTILKTDCYVKKRTILLYILLFCLLAVNFQGCTGAPENILSAEEPFRSEKNLIDKEGKTVGERIMVPDGFERIACPDDSFGQYLRNLPLKPHGSKVKYYNGQIKSREVYEAVIDLDIGNRDLQQCADAVIRLRAEYLYGQGLYDEIQFNFTNGFRADYKSWMKGNRIKVEGNNAYWVKQADSSNDYASFRKYLDMVFAYAGTLSLAEELSPIPLEEMEIGDVFLEGGSPGHCVIVVDMAENQATGEKIFLLAQSYMPAQDIHILKNPVNNEWSPWYELDFGEKLLTPEWEFTRDDLKRFPE